MWGLVAFFGALLFGTTTAGKKIPYKVRDEVFGPPAPQIVNPASSEDIDILARTIWGEARNEGYKGMQAVANVVINRLQKARSSSAFARRFGRTVKEICLKPKQFSAWNRNDPNRPRMIAVTVADPAFRMALGIAENAVMGRLPDITSGSDHYHTPAVKPSWSEGVEPVAVIGGHKFFNNIA